MYCKKKEKEIEGKTILPVHFKKYEKSCVFCYSVYAFEYFYNFFKMKQTVLY